MLPVSPEFLEAIKAGTRRFRARIEVTWTDPYLDQSIQVVANEEARISYMRQSADAVEEPAYKYLSLDGSCVPDGTYHPAPATAEEADSYQMGWWGKTLSDDIDATFSTPYPTLTVRFFARPVFGLKVVGDSARVEYPVDFDINIYEGAVLSHTEIVTGNTGISWQGDVSHLNLNTVTEMRLVIKKWSHPGRQAKIVEFFTSVQAIYGDDEIIQLNLLEEREIRSGSLPIGNVSANEIDIKLNNIDDEFHSGNTKSPLHKKVIKNRKIRAWLGLELPSGIVEYLPLGTFWSGDWSVPEQETYAATNARDRLELLRNTQFSTSQVIQNTTLYDLAELVFQDAGVPNNNYWIDTELQQYTIPHAYFESVSHREALRRIAAACAGQLYTDRKDVIRIEGPSFIQLPT